MSKCIKILLEFAFIAGSLKFIFFDSGSKRESLVGFNIPRGTKSKVELTQIPQAPDL